MPPWRFSRSGGEQQLPGMSNPIVDEKDLVKEEITGGIQPSPVPLQQLRAQLSDTKPTLQLAELYVNASGQVNCASTAPYTPTSTSKEFIPNSREPYTFENDLVRGKLLFLLNPSVKSAQLPDQTNVLVRSELFEGKTRLFWVQIQLQFKQTPPQGSVLYIGGEVPRAMQFGFFTRRGCNLLLSIIRSLVRGLHYSFGESEESKADSEDAELPHISFPLYTAVDQFVCTPEGQEPPVLGSADFGESKEDAARRRRSGASATTYSYNTKDTYSFHFHSFYLDFLQWQVTNVPGMSATDLKVFWEDMPLHLAAYFVNPVAEHSRREKKYQFCLQLSHKPRQLQETREISPFTQERHRLSDVDIQLLWDDLKVCNDASRRT